MLRSKTVKRRRIKKGEGVSVTINHLILIVVAIFWLSPFIWLFFAAFDPRATSAFKIPDSVTLHNFVMVFAGSSSARWIINSLLIAGGSATVVFAITMFAAYPFSRMEFKGKNIILWGLVLIRIIPLSAFLLPLFLLCIKLKWLNIMGVVISLAMLNIPFGLLLMKNFYDTVPKTYEEAAWVDGAGIIKTIYSILFPIAKSGAVVVWFMTFTSSWNEFMLPFILLRDPKGWPMSVGLFNSFGLHGSINFGFLAAFSVIYAIPSVLIFFLLRNNLVSGLSGAGIKG